MGLHDGNHVLDQLVRQQQADRHVDGTGGVLGQCVQGGERLAGGVQKLVEEIERQLPLFQMMNEADGE